MSNITMAKNMAFASNYHRWVFNSFDKYLAPNAVTLEVGAGHSGYTKLFSAISAKVIASDINIEVISRISNDLSCCGNVEAILMNSIEKGKLSWPIDNIVVINVIEHIEDDMEFIKNCFSVLNKQGRLVIFAPAFPFLFSDIDRQAGHFRRYLKKDLESLLKDSGFKLIFSHYFNFIGFWAWLINKYLKNGINTKSTNSQVSFFNDYIWAFRPFEMFSCFFGLSLVIVGEK